MLDLPLNATLHCIMGYLQDAVRLHRMLWILTVRPVSGTGPRLDVSPVSQCGRHATGPRKNAGSLLCLAHPSALDLVPTNCSLSLLTSCEAVLHSQKAPARFRYTGNMVWHQAPNTRGPPIQYHELPLERAVLICTDRRSFARAQSSDIH